MILTIIRMKAFPEKRKELFQVLASLVSSIREQKGCNRCEFLESSADSNEFCLFGEWEDRKDLETHMKSELFKVLLGAMSLLGLPRDIELFTNQSAPASLALIGEAALQ